MVVCTIVHVHHKEIIKKQIKNLLIFRQESQSESRIQGHLMQNKKCTNDINMKSTFSVNIRKLQVSHMCRNTLYSTALYKEADLNFFLSSYLAPSVPLPSFQQGQARATQREVRVRESKVREPR